MSLNQAATTPNDPSLANGDAAAAELTPAGPRAAPTGWWREWQIWCLAAVVLITLGSRLGTLPICGEESRWAIGGREMIATGDWIVPRQQGDVFPERPPLGSWMIALGALVSGHLGPWAIRAPSLLAAVATAFVIYGYSRTFLTRLGALGSAAAYVSFGQVLQLCQLGETESLFTFLLSGALLTWHWGYSCGWSPSAMWICGYSLAGLAALDKGPQAPIYFVAVAGVFLLLRGELRRLATWSHLAGVAAFLLIVGAWQIPFCLATDWEDVRDIWSGLARDRFKWEGLALHMLSYPLETLGCLLPWSPLLASYLFPHFRRSLGACRPNLTFLLVALCVTYPSVWLSAEARGRYFMPLYPLVAVMIGIVVERWATGTPSPLERWAWGHLVRGVSLAVLIFGVVIGVAPLVSPRKLEALKQPTWFGLAYFGAGALVFITFSLMTFERLPARIAQSRWARWARTLSPSTCLLTLVALLGATQTGALINLRLNKANDLEPVLADLRRRLPEGTRLVSLGPIAHRFAYFYEDPIPQLDWPTHLDEADPSPYFCFDLHVGDNVWQRSHGRGRRWAKTQGMLPFAWEPVACIPCDPMRKNNASMTVIVGRVLGPLDGPPESMANVAHRGPGSGPPR